MNERIKELEKQAMVTSPAIEGPLSHTYFDKEKFAELIVLECSQMVEDKFDFCGDEIIIAEKILKHFGVEE